MIRIVYLVLSAAVLLVPQAPTNQKQPVQKVARHLVVTKVQVEPLLIEETVILYDPSKPRQVKLEVVFSQQPTPRQPGALNALINGQNRDENSAWMQQQETQAKALAQRKYREITGDDQATPTIPVSYKGKAREEELVKEGYRFKAGKDHVASGAWIHLYAKIDASPGSRLGEITKKIRVAFNPTITASGVVHLNSTQVAEITPVQAPAGVNPELWGQEREREQRLASQQAAWFVVHWMNLWRIRAPKEAESAFAVGRPYTLTRRRRFWGKDREVQLRLEGQVKLEIDKPLEQKPPGQEKNNEALKSPPRVGFELARYQPSQEHRDGLYTNSRSPLESAISETDRWKAIPVVPVAQDVPNLAGNYGGSSPSGFPCVDTVMGLASPCGWTVKVIQERRKIRIVVAAVPAELTKAFGWQVGDEVFKGEVGVLRTDQGRTVWPITGQLHYRYNRESKLPNLSDFWGESAGEYYPGNLRIDGRATTDFPLGYETSWKYGQSEPYYFSRREPETKPAELVKPALEQFSIFNPDDAQSLTMVWYGNEDEVGLIASYDGDKKTDDVKQAGVRIERAGKVIYRFPEQQTKLPYDPDALGGIVYHSTLNLNSATRPTPQGKPYEFKPGDLLVAEFEGRTSRLTLVAPEPAPPGPFANIEYVPDDALPRTDIVAVNVLHREMDYPFPKTDEQKKQDTQRWLLFVLLNEYKTTWERPYRIVSSDPNIRYSQLEVARSFKHVRRDQSPLLYEGYKRVLDGVRAQDGLALAQLKGLLVVAETPRGLMPGYRSLAINGAEQDWLLDPGTITGALCFVRPVTPQINDYDDLDEAFIFDQVQVEVRTEQDVTQNEILVTVYRNKNPLEFDNKPVLVAEKVKGQRNLYRTAPIYLEEEGAPSSFPRKGVYQHRFKVGDTLTALPAESMFDSPPVDRIKVYKSPADLRTADGRSVTWEEGLRESAELWGKKVDDLARLSEEDADKFYDVYIFQLSGHTTKFRVKDHAAMLLLRRQFLLMAAEQRETLEAIRANEATLWGYHLQLKAMLQAGLNYEKQPLAKIEVENLEQRKVLLPAALQDYWRQEQIHITEPSKYRSDWVLATMRRVIDEQIKWIDGAIRHATDIDPKEIEELVNLTGNQFGTVLARARPRLLSLVEQTDSNGYKWKSWVPNQKARVNLAQVNAGLFELSSARKAARADTDALLQLLSAPGAGIGAPLYLKAIVAAANGAQFGMAIQDIRALDKQESEIIFARGAASVLGWDRFNLAEAEKQPAWSSYVNAFVSFTGFGFDIVDLSRGVALTRAYRSAPKVSAILESTGVMGMRQIPPSELRAYMLAVEDARLARIMKKSLNEAQSGLLRTANKLEAEAAAVARPPLNGAERSAASTLPDAQKLEEAQRTVTSVKQKLESGLEATKKLTPAERDSLRIVMEDARAASASGRQLSSQQKQVAELVEALEEEAARLGRESELLQLVSTQKVSKGAKVLPPIGMPRPNQIGRMPNIEKPIELGEFIAKGEYAAVYELLENGKPTGKVIKFIRKPVWEPSSLEQILARMKQGEDLAEELVKKHPGTPRLTSKFQQSGEFGIVIQDDIKSLRGYVLAEDSKGKIPAGLLKPALELYRKLVDSKIGWLDPHFRNMFFVRNQAGEFVAAGILDPDMLVREGALANNPVLGAKIIDLERGFDRDILSADTMKIEAVLDALGTLPRHVDESSVVRIFNEATPGRLEQEVILRLDPEALSKVRLESAERVMLRYLESRGLIKFDRASASEVLKTNGAARGVFVDGPIPVDLVKEYFPNLNKHVTYGNHGLDAVRRAQPEQGWHRWPAPWYQPATVPLPFAVNSWVNDADPDVLIPSLLQPERYGWFSSQPGTWPHPKQKRLLRHRHEFTLRREAFVFHPQAIHKTEAVLLN